MPGLGLGLGIFSAGQGGGIVSTVSWQLPFYTSLLSTIGPEAVAGGTSPTTAEVFDETLGLVPETVVDGVPLSRGERLTYDLTEGAETGDELIPVAADRDFSSDTGYWNKAGSCVISGGVLTINGTGSNGINKASTPLPADGSTVRITIVISRVGTGNLRQWIGGGYTIIPSTVGTHYVQSVSTPGDVFRLYSDNFDVTDIDVDSVSVEQVLPTFKNSVSKADATLLHPVNSEGVFLVHPEWSNGLVVPAGGFATDFDGVQNRYFSSVLGGTTSGTGVADDTGVTDWVEEGNYNNAVSLPHIENHPAYTQFMINPYAPPINQTIANLPIDKYSVTVPLLDGTATIAAGTAVGTGFGVASFGSPLTLDITTAGTVTVTLAGAPLAVNIVSGEGISVGVDNPGTEGDGSTTASDASEFTVTPTTAEYLRLRFADVISQTYLSSGTVAVSYDGTTITVTDGVNEMTHVVALEAGDWITVKESTGQLYFGSVGDATATLVDTNGSYAPTWGEIFLGNAVDYTFDEDLDALDGEWQQP